VTRFWGGQFELDSWERCGRDSFLFATISRVALRPTQSARDSFPGAEVAWA